MLYLFLFLLFTALKPSTVFGEGALGDMVCISLLLVGCIHYSPIRFSKFYYWAVKNKASYIIYTLFVVLLIVSLWRTSSFLNSEFNILKNSLMIFFLPVFLYFYQQYKSQNPGFAAQQQFLLLVHVLGIVCLVNMISFFIKPMYYADEPATLLGAFGYSMKKIIFPIYPKSHPNMVGALGGYLFILTSGYFLHIKNKSFLLTTILIAYIFTSIIIIFMGDSRGTLFGAFFTVSLMLFLVFMKKVQVLKYSVLALPFSNVLFIVALQLTANTSLMEQISRNGSNDLATGNSRKFIYAAANNELAEFRPIHFVGYGEYGIYGAGLIKYYMKKFGYEDESQRLISSVAHNTVLQVVFDMGYLGLAAFLWLLYMVFTQAKRLLAKGNTSFLLVFYFLVYYLLTGISETTFGNYFTFLNLMFLLFTFSTINYYNISLNTKNSEQDVLAPGVAK